MPTPLAPVSTSQAFAFAFDLALRRDPLHSLLVPLLLQAPWVLAVALLPPLDQTDRPSVVPLVHNLALLGGAAVQMTVAAMLRVRARAVFRDPRHLRPLPPGECYSRGVGRLPWLFVTELGRSLGILTGALFLLIPGLFLGFRLSVAAEAVVLDARDTAAAFRSSFRLTAGRFMSWVGMAALSLFLGLGVILFVTASCVAFEWTEPSVVLGASQLGITALTPILVYAWAFFYLRLSEIDSPSIEVGPAYAVGEADVPSRPPERSPTTSPEVGGPS